MSIVFALLATASVALLVFYNPTAIVPSFLNGAKEALEFSTVMFGVYALWIPVNKILESVGAINKLGKLVMPLEKKLFPGENTIVYDALTVNIAANALGVGGASTPAGLQAMQNMSSRKNRIMLVVLNSASIQIVPTTIIGIRAGLGAVKDIMIPILLASVITVTVAVTLVKIFIKD